MNPRIIFISGPPRSGKDTAARLLNIAFSGKAYIRRLSHPLKVLARGHTELVWEKDTEVMFEMTKDQPAEIFGVGGSGRSYRQTQIDVFNALSPVLGDDWLGRQFVTGLRAFMYNYSRETPPLVIVPDSGRGNEVAVVVEAFKPDNCIHIHMVRDGTTYDGDIRRAFKLPNLTRYEVENNGSKNALSSSLKGIGQLVYPEYNW